MNIRLPLQKIVTPKSYPQPRGGFGIKLIEAEALIEATKARADFMVDGSGMTVAVLDTGINTSHVDFDNRIIKQVNFTSEGDAKSSEDGNGHGTNVTGVIAASKDHVGIAPRVDIISLKVLDSKGRGDFNGISNALKWLVDNRGRYGVTTVCMSLGAQSNDKDDIEYRNSDIAKNIESLRNEGVAVCIAAGNDYYKYQAEGLAFPSIIRECVSVSAVFDADLRLGTVAYSDGSAAYLTGPDLITPFSQRLHESSNRYCATDIFSPGARLTSTGIGSDRAESEMDGTSQATPIAAGVILLGQQYYKRIKGELPEVGYLANTLRASGVEIIDGDDEKDNVFHTQKSFQRLNAWQFLRQIKSDLA